MHSKLFYKIIARLRISKPDYLSILAVAKRFKIDPVSAFRALQELKKAGVVKEIDPARERSNINWQEVRKIRVPKEISKLVKNMKPPRVYP